MIELLVLSVLGFALLAVFGILAAGLSVVFWVLFLPFRILGWLFKGLGVVLALPFMLLFGFVGLMIFGFGLLAFLVPFAPFVLLAWLLWRALRKSPGPSPVSS